MSGLSKESAFGSVASTSQEDLEEETPTSASNRTLNITLLSSEWKSTKGGLSTISRELAIQLAKHPDVEVSVYLPQCTEEDKKIAASLKVKIIEAEELPGYEPVDWLGSVPDNHGMDCIIGHGVHLGRQIPLIKKQNPHCKWVQIVHTAPEDLGMYKSYEEAISKGEQKHQGEVKLCELADQVVAVGPKLADAFARYLRPSKKDQDVLTLTPGIFNEFLGVEQATVEGRRFCILVFGRGDSEDFKLKGYDIAVQAVAELKDTSYQLMFVGAPAGKENEVAERLLQHGIPRSQLTVRRFKESRDQLANLFCEVDLAIMPSRTEGFGLTALEALSAGLPVLVSGNSGLGVALKEVAYGSHCVVDSEDPKEWAKKIKAVREKSREVRLAESKVLRNKYLKKYRWQESCGVLLEKMQNLVFGSSKRKNKKDKRPLSPFDNQPSKRPRGEVTHHEGPSGYGRPPVTMQYNHISYPGTTTQACGDATYQRMHTRSSSSYDRPPLSVEYNLLPVAPVTQSSTLTYLTSHPQSFPMRLHSLVEYNPLPSALASQSYGGYNNNGSHTQSFSGHDMPSSSVGSNQLPFTGVTQTYQSSPSGYGRPPLTMENKHISYPGTSTQAHGETTYHRMHTETQSTLTHNEQIYQGRFTHLEDSFGHYRPPSSVTCSQSPFVTATPAIDETSIWKSRTQPSSFGNGRPSSSVEYNQLPVASVTQSSTLTYQTSHPQCFPGRLLPSSLEYNQFPSTVASLSYQGYNNSRGHIHSFSGHDMPPSSVGHTQVPLYGGPQSYQPSRAFSLVVKFLKDEYKRRSQLKPLLWQSTLKLPLEDVYTRLKIVSRRKRDFQLQNDEVSMYGIFEDKDNVLVLVEGNPGIGKTTFCLKIAYDWAKQQIPKGYSFPEFVIVLLLKCRDIDGDIEDAIVEQLLPERIEETVKKEFMDFIKDFHYQEKVLIILDGLDELPKKSESHVDRLLSKKFLPFCYVLVTSRQERGIAVRQKVDFDILLQIQGFTEEDAFEYIRKHFRYAGPEHLVTGERLITQIKENTFLQALPSNPLNLLLLCVVFEDYQGELPSFRTELYQIIIRCLLRRYCAKHNLEAPSDDQALEEKYKDSLLVLGELAWRCLQEGRFSFREEELAKFESEIKDLSARKLGLISKEASMKKINPQHEYHFFHKTFQEYLAATYLAYRLLKEGVNVYCEFELDFLEVSIQFRQVFLFVSGILGKEASVLFKQVGERLASEGWDWLKCTEEEATLFTESFSESRNAEQMAMALCSFIPFPLTVEIRNLESAGEERDDTTFPDIFIAAEACSNFSQLQHPVHLIVEILHEDSGSYRDLEMAAQYLVSCPKLQEVSFRVIDSVDPAESVTVFCNGLSRNSTICSFTFRTGPGWDSDQAIIIGNSLAANKTLTTVTLELINEVNGAWASALERGLSADTPFTSVVLKIYGSLFAEAIGALKRVLSNRSLTSLTLIIYGEMHDSLATPVSETLVTESVLKSLTLIIYGKLSYSGAVSLERGFLENSALNSLQVKVFGELPDNWVTVTEKVLGAKKTKMSVAFHPNITGTISKALVTRPCPGFKCQSLTLNLWGELSCSGADTLCNVLITLSMCCVTLNIHGKVTDNVAECLVSYLKPCKTLSSLSINIWGELTRDGNSALQELKCNGKYSVALNVCSMASDLRICKDHNTSLTTLSLTINNCSDPSGDWGHGLGHGLAKNTSLTTLSLTINNCSDQGGDWALLLVDGLAKNTSLTTLSLTINNCSDLGGDWALLLVDGLGQNTSLTTLSLTINNCSVLSRDRALCLADGLAKVSSLTTLSLTINSYSDPSGGWAFGLGDRLAKNISLTTLSLTINNYSDLSGAWAFGLGDGLAKNISLTTLSLTINNYSDLSTEWAFGLGDGLAENISLTTLSLTINNYSDLSDDWISYLGLSLGRSKSLTVVNVTVTTCIKVSEAWLCGLCDSLAESVTISVLNFTFIDHSGTSEVLEHDFMKHFADCKSSPSLNLTVSLYGEAAVS